jgi:hypothetical protein
MITSKHFTTEMYKGQRQFYVFWLIVSQSLQFVVTFAICHFLYIDGSPFQYKTLTLAGVTTIHFAQDGVNPTPRMQGMPN